MRVYKYLFSGNSSMVLVSINTYCLNQSLLWSQQNGVLPILLFFLNLLSFFSK